MNVKALILALIWAPLAFAQGFAGLGTEAEDFAPVREGVALQFPQDHQAHPGFRIEWWYLTANLDFADGREGGAQWTLFRQAGRPQDSAEGWDSAQVWMGHAALTLPDAHFVAERFARGGVGQAGVSNTPFSAWIDHWHMTSEDESFDTLSLSAQGEGFAYDLRLEATGPLVLHGDQGLSVKSEQGQASYYYSQPHYQVTGTAVVEGQEIQVTGTAWLDREWSSQPLSGDQTGWDWFSLGFESGEKLMGFRLRHSDGRHYHSGTWIDPEGQPTALTPDQLRVTPLETTQVDGRTIPTKWALELPDKSLSVEARALNPQAFMTTIFPYWEGPVHVTGSHTGRGYLEMTGYE